MNQSYVLYFIMRHKLSRKIWEPHYINWDTQKSNILSYINLQHIRNFYFQTTYHPPRTMPSQSNQLYAPKYEHDKPMPRAAPQYSTEWKDMRDELLEGMTAGANTTARIDNGPGDRRTVHTNIDLRYDRERVLAGNGHPADKFTNYQIQANKGSKSKHLKNLAASGNGQHKALGGFGGSTVASVNLQQTPAGRRLTPIRVMYALEHSNRYGETIHVLDRRLNEATVPANMRQKTAMYHKNPYDEWLGRNDKGNLYQGVKDDGTLPAKSCFYTGPNGSTKKSTDSQTTTKTQKTTTDVKVCRHCNHANSTNRTKCGKCGKKL
jgi:ribosomal protein L40E